MISSLSEGFFFLSPWHSSVPFEGVAGRGSFEKKTNYARCILYSVHSTVLVRQLEAPAAHCTFKQSCRRSFAMLKVLYFRRLVLKLRHRVALQETMLIWNIYILFMRLEMSSKLCC